MKLFICLLLLLFSLIAFSQQNNQIEKKNKLESELTFSFNSNGIAPIPAFSLDNPAIIGSVNLRKGRLSYSPTLAYGLDMKPWYIDNWFHYQLVKQSNFEIKTGVNFSTFLSKYMLMDEEILKGERYLAFSLSVTYGLSDKSDITFNYWNDNGLESGSISGHFFSLVYDRLHIKITDKTSVGANIMIFYLNYDGNNDGLFFSPTISLSANNKPISFFFQATQAINTNIPDLPGFRWNIGISYTL